MYKNNEKITGYKVTKSILSFSSENPEVKASHISTFIYFGEISNECNWATKIEISREKLLKITGIGTQRTYKKVLEDLEKWKAIKIHSYASNQFIPYDVIEIDKRFVNKTKSLLNHCEINTISEQEQSNDIYNKTYKHLNHKLNNTLEIFLEKNDFENFQKLKTEDQKLMLKNLKTVFIEKFELLLSQDLSQINFEIQYTVKTNQNSAELSQNVIDDIQRFFGTKELNNSQLFTRIKLFVDHLNYNNQLETFNKNFTYYIKYKQVTSQVLHSVAKFIGTPERDYKDGIWISENFESKLQQHENKRNRSKLIIDLEIDEGKKNVLNRMING